MTDGCTGYQHLLSRIKGIGQCGQHVIRRARQVAKLGPGSLQQWAHDVIKILGEANAEVERARARGSTALDQQVLDDLRERYDTAVKFGLTHNRLRDWDGGGNHPGYALATWLRGYKEQVFLFTRHFGVSFTNNMSERGAKAAKRHRPCRDTGTTWSPLPAGAESAATSTPQPPTASPPSTPSPPPSRKTPGCRHSQLSS